MIRVLCQCGIAYNFETSPLCPVCSQGIILNNYEQPEGFIKRILRPKKKIKVTLRIKLKKIREYHKLYARKEHFKIYRREYARRKRTEQKEKFGKMLW